MTESEFEALAGDTLAALEAAFEFAVPDADVQTKGEGVLEIEFDDGAKMIVNRHGSAREIWVAAPSGGFHFRYDGGAWRNTRDGTELFDAVSALCSQQTGTAVVLRGPRT
jgi:CyaY protein